MKPPVAILLVFNRGSSHQVDIFEYADEFGHRPPSTLAGENCAYDSHRRWLPRESCERRTCYMCAYPTIALPLLWNDKLVPAAWDYARREFAHIAVGLAEIANPSVDQLIEFAGLLANEKAVERVLYLNEEGRPTNTV